MAIELNSTGESHCRSLISAGKVDKTSAWNFTTADEDNMLGKDGEDWSMYGMCHLGIDPSESKDTKAHYKYPCCKCDTEQNCTLYRSGLIAIRQRAGQQGADAIFKAAGALIELIDGPEEEQENSVSSRKTAKANDKTAMRSFFIPERKTMTIEELKNRLAELSEQAKSIQASADAEKRDLTADEATKIDGIFAEFGAVEDDINRRSRLAGIVAKVDDKTPEPRRAAPTTPAPTGAAASQNAGSGLPNTIIRTPAERGRWGWQNFGDFCKAVKVGATPGGGSIDPRLVLNASLSTYGQEGTGADGGFAVPPEWRATIMELVEAEDSLLGRTDQQQASGNSITFPVDETTPWQTTGGIQAYWDGEAAAQSQSKPNIIPMSIRLNRLTALVPVTDELLEDAPAMGAYVQRKAGEKIAFKITDAIINGDGAGMPQGILTSGALVSVAKEGSQVAGSLLAPNVAKMWGRMYGPSRKNAVWLYNQDIEQALYQMVIQGKNVAGSENVGVTTPVFLPPGGFSGSQYATLFGRPMIPTEACSTLGTKGDLILADLTKYLTVVKASGLRTDVSIHLWFDQATTAFRFIFRLAGQPWISKPITRKNGSNTLSHYVSLDNRT